MNHKKSMANLTAYRTSNIINISLLQSFYHDRAILLDSGVKLCMEFTTNQTEKQGYNCDDV
jgi:hypothetical protein